MGAHPPWLASPFPVAGMRKVLRLISRAERDALADTELHIEIRTRWGDQARVLSMQVAEAYGAEAEPHLDEVCRMLADRLQGIDDLRARVQQEASVGGTGLASSRDFFEALALWVIENQVADGVVWHPERRLRRLRNRRSLIDRLLGRD